MSKGVIMFAINNDLVDYITIAAINARMVKKHMGVPTTLITDEDGAHWASTKFGKDFDQIIINTQTSPYNKRTYLDTQYSAMDSDFKNFSRPSAYELSPYDETILMDADYLIQDDSLNTCWGSVEEIMINKDALSIRGAPLNGEEFRLNEFGIRMYWATVVYFKKTPAVKVLFDMVNFVRENWEFYQLTYNFPNRMYRNDYAFSIAIHTLNGFQETNEIKTLPIPYILTATDRDQLYRIQDDGLIFFAEDDKDHHNYHSVRIEGMNVHCMNKISLERNMKAFKAMYE